MVVVVLPPIVDHAAHMAQTGKPLLRQAFVAKAAIEAFDVGILRWLAWLNEAMLDSALSRPRLHHAPCELGAVVVAAASLNLLRKLAFTETSFSLLIVRGLPRLAIASSSSRVT